MIELNLTLLIQVVNFLIGLAIINYFFVRPIRAVIARRRAQNDARREETEGLENSAGEKLDGYKARVAAARADAAAARERIRAAADKQVRDQLAEASEKARGIYSEASERIRREYVQAEAELDAKAGEFAKLALNRILG